MSLTHNPLAESLPQRPHTLSVLNISDTPIVSWDYLSHLSLILPHLHSLRISAETLSKQRSSSNFHANLDNLPTELINSLIIARFANLTLLNGSKVLTPVNILIQITPLERENSELYYLSKIESPNDHPRYHELLNSSLLPFLI